MASIVDLRVFWQPGSIFNVLDCDGLLLLANKYLLLLSLPSIAEIQSLPTMNTLITPPPSKRIALHSGLIAS